MAEGRLKSNADKSKSRQCRQLRQVDGEEGDFLPILWIFYLCKMFITSTSTQDDAIIQQSERKFI